LVSVRCVSFGWLRLVGLMFMGCPKTETVAVLFRPEIVNGGLIGLLLW